MIYKTTQASKYLGVSINTIKTLSNRLKLKSFKTAGGHRRFRQEDFDLLFSQILWCERWKKKGSKEQSRF